jgi:hypothetical protein
MTNGKYALQGGALHSGGFVASLYFGKSLAGMP